MLISVNKFVIQVSHALFLETPWQRIRPGNYVKVWY